MIKEKKIFGYLGGTPVYQYTLQNKRGAEADILSYGGVLRALRLPAPKGMIDVVLGYDTLRDYLAHDKYMGAVVGRVSNRIGNGRFSLNGREYSLFCNNGPNHLHGGKTGFDKKVWSDTVEGDSLCLSLVSPDGEEGYPGNLMVQVRYSLADDCRLIMEIRAETSADTPVSITNHSYFNLNGHESGDIGGHRLTINALKYLPIDENGLPEGRIAPVAETPFDFRREKEIGRGLEKADEQLRLGNGYDHSFLIENGLAAVCRSPQSGVTLTLVTTQPALQFYTGNYLDGAVVGKNGAFYKARSGFCLEAQMLPNAVNMFPAYNPVLKKGEIYRQRIEYRFDFT